MSRKRTSFDAFMKEVEAETRDAGPLAQAEAGAVRNHFRLAAQVLRRRRELGLTQRQLADLVGIHQSEISDIERGASTPGYRTLAKLAVGLQAEVAFVPWKVKVTPLKGAQAKAGARRTLRPTAMARGVAAKGR